jgi:hypothetical protein
MARTAFRYYFYDEKREPLVNVKAVVLDGPMNLREDVLVEKPENPLSGGSHD